jgi:hypothetical protein
VHGRRRVVCFFRYGVERELRLDVCDGGWLEGWCFLGVQEVSEI